MATLGPARLSRAFCLFGDIYCDRPHAQPSPNSIFDTQNPGGTILRNHERTKMIEITVKMAAEAVGVSERSIQYWIKSGRFPGAHQIDPNIKNSPYLIPENQVEAERKRRQQNKK